MKILKKLLLVKEVITQLIVCQIIHTLKIPIKDLRKQQALDADPRVIQQINFTANLDRAGNTRIYFILEEAKETILDFSQGSVKVLQVCYITIFSLI